MAKSLNLKVIAEGVENEAQMAFLRAHQCDEIQGYYFSKPLPVDKVADKLRGDAPHANSEGIVGAPEVSGLDTQSNMASLTMSALSSTS
jgi:predicted signal transduction protein with EAL and GGDEF domain